MLPCPALKHENVDQPVASAVIRNQNKFHKSKFSPRGSCKSMYCTVASLGWGRRTFHHTLLYTVLQYTLHSTTVYTIPYTVYGISCSQLTKKYFKVQGPQEVTALKLFFVRCAVTIVNLPLLYSTYRWRSCVFYVILSYSAQFNYSPIMEPALLNTIPVITPRQAYIIQRPITIA